MVIRNGLVYERRLDYGDPVHIYAPDGPFTVDGIEYVPNKDRYCHRPMIEVFRDGASLCHGPSIQFWSTGEGWPR